MLHVLQPLKQLKQAGNIHVTGCGTSCTNLLLKVLLKKKLVFLKDERIFKMSNTQRTERSTYRLSYALVHFLFSLLKWKIKELSISLNKLHYIIFRVGACTQWRAK